MTASFVDEVGDKAPEERVELEAPARIAVVGCGHVGLVMAAGLAKLGHHVVGIDRNAELVANLTHGEVPFLEPGLDELVHGGLEAGNLAFTTAFDGAITEAEFIFLAVDTPATLAGAADLRNIRAATKAIAASLNGKNPIIVNKSTSPIGTGETIETILREALAGRQEAPRIVSNPEFLRQGRAVYDFLNPDRIVVGARTHEDGKAVAGLYGDLSDELVVTDLRTAEMIKYVSNSFLALKISFINEISRICEHIAVDIDQVIEGISLDPRIGPHFLNPGIGFGGSCLPKDVAALRYMGETLGVATPILSAVQEVNQGQRTAAVRRLRARLGTLEGKRVGVWGVTFKGETEDARESPAVDVISLLLNEGAEIRAYNPRPPLGLPAHIRELLVDSPVEAARDADALAVLSDWPQFRDVPLEDVRDVMRGIVLFDGRNLLNRADVERHGFAYLGIGRIARLPKRRRSDQ